MSSLALWRQRQAIKVDDPRGKQAAIEYETYTFDQILHWLRTSQFNGIVPIKARFIVNLCFLFGTAWLEIGILYAW